MEINIEKIKKSLDELNKRFNDEVEKKDVDNFQLSIYCKIASLELCGWLEETYDELIRSALRSKNIGEKNLSDFNEKFIKKVNGLSYKEHLRVLIINAFGFIKIIQIESKVLNIDVLKASLDELHKYRNHLAHNQYLNYNDSKPTNPQQSIDTPNKVKSKFEQIYPILKEVAQQLHS